MFLHVPTLLAAIFMAFGLFGAALMQARSSLRDCVELRLWAWSTWALVAGFVVLVARVVLPKWVSVFAGNGLIFVSLFLVSQAVHRFIHSRAAGWWHLALMVLGIVCTGLIIERPIAQRSAVVSALLAVQLAPIVWLIVRHGWHAEHSLRTVAVAQALTMVALTFRAIDAVNHPAAYADFFQASLGNGLTYLASYLFPLGAGFGFLLANFERSRADLQELAAIDTLTGCVRRHAFESLLEHARERAQRVGSALSLLVIDIDHFKQINDSHGHIAGDTVLRRFAGTIRARLRSSDVFARLGGEEFAVILNDTDETGSLRVAEDLRGAIEEMDLAQLSPIARVTISIGVSTVSGKGVPSTDEMVERADRALYAAKHAGRNRVIHAGDEREASAGALKTPIDSGHGLAHAASPGRGERT
jgi:diguanylate cyclase (GGDEF)-like protein